MPILRISNNVARRRVHRERVFRDRSHPFEIYDEAELFTRYRFRRADNMNLVYRKTDHAINVQLSCDADASIMNCDCVVRWPESVHDARILRESAVFPMFETMPRPLEGYILGDSGYMLKDWLLTPYIHIVNAEQQRYNGSHCATRCIIERCNGILKRRWHCLHIG